MMTLEEQIEYAETFIGKRILGIAGDVSGMVEEVAVVHKNKYPIIFDYAVRDDKSGRISDIFENQSVAVFLRGKWNNTNANMTRSINPKEKDIKLAKKEVKINGFVGIDRGLHFEFGCARIARIDLHYALKYLEQYENSGLNGFKYPQSVRFGKGEFTLQDMRDLLDS
jgi:hypothetical protein